MKRKPAPAPGLGNERRVASAELASAWLYGAAKLTAGNASGSTFPQTPADGSDSLRAIGATIFGTVPRLQQYQRRPFHLPRRHRRPRHALLDDATFPGLEHERIDI